MADAFSSRPESWDPDGPPRPPTFVQIRPPAAPGNARRKVGILGIGLALVMALGWGLYRVTDVREAPVVLQAAPVVTDAPAAQQVFGDFYPELVRRSVDTASSTPIWSSGVAARTAVAIRSVGFRSQAFQHAAGRNSQRDASRFIGVIGAAREGRYDRKRVAKAWFCVRRHRRCISPVAPHVRLKRLPTGLGMTVQIRPRGGWRQADPAGAHAPSGWSSRDQGRAR